MVPTSTAGQIKLVAELLLEKETINHDDLVSLIGARPFKAHKSYLEFISANEDAKQKMADADGEGREGSATAGGGGDADSAAASKPEGESAASKAGDSDSATQEKGGSSEGASGSKEP